MSRIALNETERTLVERARAIEKLRDRKAKLEGELVVVTNDLAMAQKALVDDVTQTAPVTVKEVPVGELAPA